MMYYWNMDVVLLEYAYCTIGTCLLYYFIYMLYFCNMYVVHLEYVCCTFRTCMLYCWNVGHVERMDDYRMARITVWPEGC